MRAFDVRWIRLAIAAGAIVGSALVSSVAVATDESLPIEPSTTAPADVASVDVEQDAGDVIVIEPQPGAPFEDVAVIEIVMPELVGPETASVETVGTPADRSVSVDESTTLVSPEPMPATSLESTDLGAVEPEEPGSEHQGGSGGQGNPYRMTFEVGWFDAEGKQITALDVVVPPEVLAQFELSAASQTGKGKATSATCTYPDGGTVLRCEFHNPGDGSGSDGLIIPARPTATYTVAVEWPVDGWTISGADDADYSARDLCPRGGEGGGGGHEEGGGEEGGGHEEGRGEEGGGHESGGGGEGGSGVPCVHTVVMRQVAPAVPPPPPPEQPQPPAAPPAQDAGVVPPVVTSPAVTPPATAPEVQSAAAAPGSLPATGGSISMLILIAGALVLMGSAAAGLTRRTS